MLTNIALITYHMNFHNFVSKHFHPNIHFLVAVQMISDFLNAETSSKIQV